MKLVYLAEIKWVMDAFGKEESFYSIIDEFDTKNREKVVIEAKKVFENALIYNEQQHLVSLIENDEGITVNGTEGVIYSQSIYVSDSNLSASYMSVSFRPVIKAANWFYELKPIPLDRIFI